MEKAKFVKDLCEFYTQKVNAEFGIKSMEYKSDLRSEWVFVTFESNSRKKFDVSGDSNQGIMSDFIRFVTCFDEYPWIM